MPREASVSNTTTHGTARFRASELIEQALNGRTPTAYDEREDGTARHQPAGDHRRAGETAAAQGPLPGVGLGGSERAARLARDYNERFNNLRLRKFDGAHLTLPGHGARGSARP